MVKILDATLREGEQTPGVYFDGHIKLAIADLLDEIGIDIIEAGHPMVTPEIHEAVYQIAHHGYRAIVAAHSRSLRQDVDLALECGVQFIGIFYSVTAERLDQVFRKDLNTAINQITDVIRYAKEKNPELLIRYTPEDTVRSPFKNVIEAASAAVSAGADIISVADTTGFMVPGTEYEWKLSKLPELYQLVSRYSGIPIPENFPIIGQNAFTHCAGVHTHAAVQNPVHYQSLDPALVGREMTVALDHMSGISSVQWALEKLGLEYTTDLLKRILAHIKQIGQKGRTVDLHELKHLVEWCKKHPLKK